MLSAKANPASGDRGAQKATVSWWDGPQNNRHARTSKATPPRSRSACNRASRTPLLSPNLIEALKGLAAVEGSAGCHPDRGADQRSARSAPASEPVMIGAVSQKPRQAVVEILDFMRRNRLALDDLIQVGGKDFTSASRKRIEKTRRVSKCWELMARLSVKFAALAQTPPPMPDKPARRRSLFTSH
jgi:hypothetical protein